MAPPPSAADFRNERRQVGLSIVSDRCKRWGCDMPCDCVRHDCVRHANAGFCGDGLTRSQAHLTTWSGGIRHSGGGRAMSVTKHCTASRGKDGECWPKQIPHGSNFSMSRGGCSSSTIEGSRSRADCPPFQRQYDVVRSRSPHASPSVCRDVLDRGRDC